MAAAAVALALVGYGFWFTWPAGMGRFEGLDQEHRAWLATAEIPAMSESEATHVYTGLAFFRELPAGVTGAYRLFANLLALAE